MGNLISYIKKLFNNIKSYFNFFNFFNFKFFLFFSIFYFFYFFYFFDSITFYYNETCDFFLNKKKVINNENNIINTETTLFNFIDELNDTHVQVYPDLKIYTYKLTKDELSSVKYTFNLYDTNETTPFDIFLEEVLNKI